MTFALPLRIPAALAGFLLAALAAPVSAAEGLCPPPGAWTLPATSGAAPVALRTVLDHVADRRVVLLGEHHDSMEHHRWQLHVASAMLSRNESIVLALEMFPRAAQPVLDRWVAGELTEKAFLEQSQWSRVWRFDAQLYLPLFHFARIHRIPMVALNIDNSLTRKVSQVGFDGVAELRELGISRPAEPMETYRDFLWASFSQHSAAGDGKDSSPADNPQFRRFLESQLTWDRAMAHAIRDALTVRPGARVVALLGSGHAMNGWGVEWQLRDMGIGDVASFLPSDAGMPCADIEPGQATALFGVGETLEGEQSRPRLGVWLEMANDRVSVRKVEDGSIASQAGVQAGDVLVEVAGRSCRTVEDVVDRIVLQPPGSWLPLKVSRGTDVMDLIAKFPAQR